MFDAVVQKFRNASPWHILGAAVIAAEILTLAIVAVMSVILRGEVTYDYLLTGAVAAFLVSLVVTSLIVAFTVHAREMEERYRDLVELSPGAIAVHVRGNIVFINDAGAKMFGVARKEEIIGRPVMDFVHPDYREEVAKRIGGIEERNEQAPLEEERLVRADGSAFDAEVAGMPFVHGGERAVLVVVHDITGRKRVEESLKGVNLFLENIMENISSAVIVLDAGEKFILTNRSFQSMTGHSAKELVGQPFSSVFSPDDYIKAKRECLGALHGGAGVKGCEMAMTGKNGKKVVVSLSAAPVYENGRLVSLVCAADDVTERKRTEETLRKTQFVVDNTSDGVYWVGPDARIVSVNDAVCESLGYTRDELLTLTIHDISPDFPPGVWKGHWDEVRKRRSFLLETRGRKKDGAVFPVEVMINHVIFEGEEYNCAFVRDISERKRVEEELTRANTELEKARDAYLNIMEDLGTRKAELEKTRESLSKAQEIAHVGNWEWDIAGNTLRWSDEIYRIFGRAPGEFGNTYEAFLSYVHPDDRAWVQHRVNEAIGKKSQYDIDHRIITHDGGERIVHEMGMVDYDETGRAVAMVGTVQDITERKHLETALRESEERLGYALQATGEGVWDWHLATDQVFHNTQWCHLLGLDEKFLVHPLEDFAALLHVDDRAAVMERIQWCLDGKGSYQSEHRMKTANRGYIQVLDRGEVVARDGVGKPLRMIGSFTDITARKTAEDNLRASEQRFRAVAQSASDAIVSINGAGEIIHWNKGAEMMFGLAEAEALGKPVGMVVPKRYDEAHRRGLARAAGGGPFRLVGKTTMLEGLRKDGSEFPLELSLAAWEEGGKPYFTGIIRDVTERKAAEDRLRAAKEEAEKATSLKDKYVSLVSHDLKNPLGTVMGFLKLIREDLEGKGWQYTAKLTDAALESAGQMQHLINEVLSIGRIKSGVVRPSLRFFDAFILGVKAGAFLAPSAEKKGIKLVNAIPEGTRFYSDETLLGEVVHNLVSNAVKFCKSGDTITLFVPDDGPATIAVKDTGVGIKKDIIPKLFIYEEKTSTTGTAGERGTGLGLPLSRDIMTTLGGSLDAESEPGKGSVFYARLPHVRPRVLIVDDDGNDRLLLGGYLSGLNVTVLEAEDGRDALRVIRESAPHLLVVDIVMPNMDGFELLEAVRSNPATASTPFIMIAIQKNMEVNEKSLRMGADDFINKPISMEEFIPRVRRFIG